MSSHNSQSSQPLQVPSGKLARKASAEKLADSARVLGGHEFIAAGVTPRFEDVQGRLVVRQQELSKPLAVAADVLTGGNISRNHYLRVNAHHTEVTRTSTKLKEQVNADNAGRPSVGSAVTSLTQPSFADPLSPHYDVQSDAGSDAHSLYGRTSSDQTVPYGHGSGPSYHGGGFQNPAGHPTTPAHYPQIPGNAQMHSSFSSSASVNPVATPGGYHAAQSMGAQGMGSALHSRAPQTYAATPTAFVTTPTAVATTPTAVVATPTAAVQTRSYKAGKHLPHFVADNSKGSFIATLKNGPSVKVHTNASGEMAYFATDNKWYQVVAV